MTPAAIDQVWVRLKAGQAAKPTARELGLCTSTVRAYLIRWGGIQPVPRRRCPSRLSFGGAGGDLPRARGGVLDPVDRGSVGSGAVVGLPVVARNGGRRAYRAARADRVAWDRAARPKRCRLAGNRVLRGIVAVKMVRRWSQQQIAGWLTATYPDVPELQVSLESIYRTLYVQSRGALRKELTRYLGTGRVPRHPQECGCRKGAAADRAPSTSRTSPSLRSAPGWRDCAGGQRRAAGGAADPGRPATGPEGRAHPQDLAACISFSWS